MSKPFNFYQYAGTGQGQYIAPFVTFFTGFYFPPDLALGQNVGFIWRLFDDDLYYPQTYKINITGRYSRGQNLPANFYIGFSGDVFPLIQDSGNYSFSFTGQPVQTSYDTPTLGLNLTGQYNQDNDDPNNININISGQSPVTLNDFPILSINPHFQYTGGMNLINNMSIGFTGGFIKNNKDSQNIDINLFQVSFNMGTSEVIIFTGDNANIDISFVSVFFKQA